MEHEYQSIDVNYKRVSYAAAEPPAADRTNGSIRPPADYKYVCLFALSEEDLNIIPLKHNPLSFTVDQHQPPTSCPRPTHPIHPDSLWFSSGCTATNAAQWGFARRPRLPTAACTSSRAAHRPSSPGSPTSTAPSPGCTPTPSRT